MLPKWKSRKGYWMRAFDAGVGRERNGKATRHIMSLRAGMSRWRLSMSCQYNAFHLFSVKSIRRQNFNRPLFQSVVERQHCKCYTSFKSSIFETGCYKLSRTSVVYFSGTHTLPLIIHCYISLIVVYKTTFIHICVIILQML